MRFNNIHPQRFNMENRPDTMFLLDEYFEDILQSNSLATTKLYYLTESSLDHIYKLMDSFKEGEAISLKTIKDIIYIIFPPKLAAQEGLEGFYYYNNQIYPVDTMEGRYLVYDAADLEGGLRNSETYTGFALMALMVKSISQDLNFPSINSKTRKKISGQVYRNKSKFKVHIINDTLHNGFTRRVDKCDVKGFVRLQRYGPGHSKVKKVYIQPHVRKFKKDKPLEDS